MAARAKKATEPAEPARFVRFLESVQGTYHVSAGDVARNPWFGLLVAAKYETIAEADYKAACRAGHRNTDIEAPGEV